MAVVEAEEGGMGKVRLNGRQGLAHIFLTL